jgi:hypothetical protein
MYEGSFIKINILTIETNVCNSIYVTRNVFLLYTTPQYPMTPVNDNTSTSKSSGEILNKKKLKVASIIHNLDATNMFIYLY